MFIAIIWHKVQVLPGPLRTQRRRRARAALALFGEGHSGHVPFDPGLAAAALILALALGLIASAYPAAMAARMDPNEALRSL